MLRGIIKIYEYREMLKNTVKKDLRARYKASVLGFLWTFINPLLLLVVYSLVFSQVMKITVPMYSYTLFLFVGLIPWNFFSNTVILGTTSIITSGNLIKKVYFPRAIIPISVTLTNLINMLLTFIIIFAVVLISGCPITWLYVLIPFVILIESILALAFCMIVSCITVYFRDLEHILSVGMMAWFYLTPIVYTNDYIPEKYIYLFNLNPLYHLINAYRDILMYNTLPNLLNLIYVFIFSLVLLCIGYLIFDKLQRRFAEEI